MVISYHSIEKKKKVIKPQNVQELLHVISANKIT